MAAVLSFPLDPPVLEQPLAGASPEALFRAPSRPHQHPRRAPAASPNSSTAPSSHPNSASACSDGCWPPRPFPIWCWRTSFTPPCWSWWPKSSTCFPATGWTDIKSQYESTRRSVLGVALGPASQLYFDIINSGWFTDWLSSISGVPYLLPDPKLFGGGLHESRTGATFAVHRDFNRHRHLGLKNEMVFITYLNKGWDPDWGSGLELWDKKEDHCVTTVQPEFGRTILLPHGPASYHGHTKPLQAPDGRPRRSVAAYYYTSPLAGKQHGDESASVFMRTRRIDRSRRCARMLTPPVVWAAGAKDQRARLTARAPRWPA